MKNKTVKIIIALIIILIIGSSIFIYFKYTENKKIAEIKSQFDTKLTDYQADKSLALSCLDIVTINNADKYAEVKNKIHSKLSIEMQNELFGSENYTSSEAEEIKYTVVDIKGTLEENNAHIYKVQYYTVINYKTTDYFALIKVADGLIVSFKTFII